MLCNQNDVLTVFPAFINHVYTQYKSVITIIHSDNAPELAFTQLVKQYGMIYQFFCAYTPQQNSKVERKNQLILNVACALLFQSNACSLISWSACVCTTVFLINRTPSAILLTVSLSVCIPSVILGNKTPYELLTKKVQTILS